MPHALDSSDPLPKHSTTEPTANAPLVTDPLVTGPPIRESGLPSLTVASGVAEMWLNRPAQHNRLVPADIDRLAEILDEVAADPSIRVLVLRARGKSFCAGYDLADLATPPAEKSAAATPDGGIGVFAITVDRLEACRVPTICALNGSVYGGGTDLALACDFRIGVAGCGMFMPAGKFGLHYYHGGLRRYAARLGIGAAKRLFLLGETINAEEMHRIGYLDEVLSDHGALEKRTADMARIIVSAASADTINGMKRCLNRIAAGDMDPTEADAAWHRTRSSAEVAQAVAAHLASRRKPG